MHNSSSSQAGVVSYSSWPSMNMEGTGAGLPRLRDSSIHRVAPLNSLVMTFSQDTASPKVSATDSTTRAMYTQGIQ